MDDKLQISELHVEVTARQAAGMLGLMFGREITEADWLRERPALWHPRERWAWAGRKPYTHTFTHVAPTSFIGMSATYRELPPEGTVKRAWMDFTGAGHELGALVIGNVRGRWVRLKRAVRGR